MRTNILTRIRISTRIGILVFLGLSGVGAIAGIYAYTDRQIEAIETRTAEARQLGTNTEEVEKASLELRRREKDFLLRRELRYAEQYGKYSGEIQTGLSAIEAMPVAASLREHVGKLKAGFASHRTEFTKLVEDQKTLGLDENQGLQGALRKSVREVEAKVREANDHELMALMLTMRRHEKDFLLRSEKRYADALAATHVEFEKALAGSKLSEAARTDIGKLLDAYQADFDKLVAIELHHAEEVKVLSKIFADMQDSFDALLNRSKELVAESESVRVAAKASASTMLWSTVAIVGLLLLVFSAIVALSIVRPLRGMVGAMLTVAKGDLDIAVPALGQKDEVGDLAGALETFRENGLENRRLQAEQKEAEKRAEQEKRALMTRMADDFDKAVGGIVGAVSSAAEELQAAAQTMSSTAEEASRQSSAVAAASEQASANVQTVATAAEELSSSVGEIGRQVNQSSTISAQAVGEADRTNATVQGLATAAQKIGDVVKLINDIAGQTNLLALNATIEAARAGEAGKGFAVVASEVKSLANQTAKATEEIGGQVTAIQGATTESVQAITGITGTIRQMNEIATSIASAVEEQGAATQEIARNVQQAARGTEEVSSNIAGVNKASSEAGAASTQVLSSARELSQQSAKLRTEVDRFLQTVRAA